MIIVILILLGLCLGSFVNALVWRIHEQAKPKNKRIADDSDLSVATGRSMCVNCQHTLAWYDLLPVISWIMLGGKCRYCNKPISWQYPLVELATAGLFVVSYFFWPSDFQHPGTILSFLLWLILLVGFVALILYDLRWMLLPDRIVFPLQAIAALYVVVQVAVSPLGWEELLTAFWGVVFSAGLFYLIFQISNGKWIGGGDVKLAVVLGLVLGGPANALLMLFTASLMGSIVGIPLLLQGKAKKDSKLPFGPFLIIATIIVFLFGSTVIDWYKQQLSLV